MQMFTEHLNISIGINNTEIKRQLSQSLILYSKLYNATVALYDNILSSNLTLPPYTLHYNGIQFNFNLDDTNNEDLFNNFLKKQNKMYKDFVQKLLFLLYLYILV